MCGLPTVEDDLLQISNDGGGEPLWSRNGQELFYLQPGSTRHMISASIESREDGLSVTNRDVIMEWPYRRLGEAPCANNL